MVLFIKKEIKIEIKFYLFIVLLREMSFYFIFNGDIYYRMLKVKGF